MRRRVRVVLAGSVLVLGFVGYQAARWSRLSERSLGLIQTAAGFPKDYTIGAPSASTLVVLGDSAALGVGVSRLDDTMAYRLADAAATREGIRRVVNLSVSGARLADVAREQLPKLPTGALPLVFVSVSANDATHGTDPAVFENDLEGLLAFLGKRKVARVVLTTTPNFHNVPALPFPARNVVAGRALRLASIVRQVATRYPFVRLAELNRDGTLSPDQYAEDGFHPNAEGYRKWADIVRSAAYGR